MVEARAAADIPTMHRTASTTKNDPASTVHSLRLRSQKLDGEEARAEDCPAGAALEEGQSSGWFCIVGGSSGGQMRSEATREGRTRRLVI